MADPLRAEIERLARDMEPEDQWRQRGMACYRFVTERLRLALRSAEPEGGGREEIARLRAALTAANWRPQAVEWFRQLEGICRGASLGNDTWADTVGLCGWAISLLTKNAAGAPPVPVDWAAAAKRASGPPSPGEAPRCKTCGDTGYVMAYDSIEPGISVPAGEDCPDCDGPRPARPPENGLGQKMHDWESQDSLTNPRCRRCGFTMLEIANQERAEPLICRPPENGEAP